MNNCVNEIYIYQFASTSLRLSLFAETWTFKVLFSLLWPKLAPKLMKTILSIFTYISGMCFIQSSIGCPCQQAALLSLSTQLDLLHTLDCKDGQDLLLYCSYVQRLTQHAEYDVLTKWSSWRDRDIAHCGNLWPYQDFSTQYSQNTAADSVLKIRLPNFVCILASI